MRIKQVSFDVWNTLITANPQFSVERDRFLAEALQSTPEQVRGAYKTLKTQLDQDAEQFGKGYKPSKIYRKLLDGLGRGDLDSMPIQAGLEALFRAYPPYLDINLRASLRNLKDEGFEISIASNTNFIRGAVLSEVVLTGYPVIDIDWAYQIFSDEWEVSKPHRLFWEEVKHYSKFKPEEILHIGDNKICDGGCTAYGLSYLWVSSPAGTLKALQSRSWAN